MTDIVLAQILGGNGLKGDVALRVYAQEPKSLLRFSFELGKITSIKPGAKGVWIAHIEGVNDRDAADALKGRQFTVTRADLPPPPENEFYITDLVGLKVLENGIMIGTVTDAPDFGAGTLLDIRLPDGKTLYLPFRHEFVGEVDLAAGTVEVFDHKAFVV